MSADTASEKWTARADWVDAEDGTIVCVTPQPDFPESFGKWPERRQIIAAAPDMLAALRVALPELAEDLISVVDSTTLLAFDWQPEEPLPSSFDDPESEAIARSKKAAYDAVVAAIAKAEGRA